MGDDGAEEGGCLGELAFQFSFSLLELRAGSGDKDDSKV